MHKSIISSYVVLYFRINNTPSLLINPERNERYTNEEKKLGSLLTSLQNIVNPEAKLEPILTKIEREVFRIKDIIARKKYTND